MGNLKGVTCTDEPTKNLVLQSRLPLQSIFSIFNSSVMVLQPTTSFTKTHCALPSQHQTAHKDSNYLAGEHSGIFSC